MELVELRASSVDPMGGDAGLSSKLNDASGLVATWIGAGVRAVPLGDDFKAGGSVMVPFCRSSRLSKSEPVSPAA
jgi:hypothetical protein